MGVIQKIQLQDASDCHLIKQIKIFKIQWFTIKSSYKKLVITLESAKGTIPKWSTYFLYAIGLTLAYILSGFFCIPYLSPLPENYSLIWLPSGVGLLLFMVLGYSAIFLGISGKFYH